MALRVTPDEYARWVRSIGGTVGPSVAEGLAKLARVDGPHAAPLAKLPGKVSEAEFQTQVIDFAHLHGWRVAHFRKVRVQRKDGTVYWQTPVAADGKGFFDLVMVRGRLVLWVELKIPGGRIEPDQQAWHSAMKAAGEAVFVWFPQDWPETEATLR